MPRGPNNYPVDLHRLSVPEDWPRRVKAAAKALDRPEAWVRREALREYLERIEASHGLTS